jgi:hypothetical protein
MMGDFEFLLLYSIHLRIHISGRLFSKNKVFSFVSLLLRKLYVEGNKL